MPPLSRTITKLLVGAVLASAALVAWLGLRASQTVAGPDEPLAEILLGSLPVVYALFALLSLPAARTLAQAARHERALPVRLVPKDNPWNTDALGGLVTWHTVTCLLAFAFVVSLYPDTWSAAWDCAATGPGETSCSLTHASALRYVLFGLNCINAPLFALAALPLTRSAVRGLRRTAALAPPMIELSTSRLWPGSHFDLAVTLCGRTVIDGASVRLLCEERCTFRSGTSDATETAIACSVPLASASDVRLAGDQPLAIRAACTVPATAMHTFAGKSNRIAWWIELELQRGAVTTLARYPVIVRAQLG